MESPFGHELAEEIKEDLQNNKQDAAIAKIQKYLDQMRNIPVNITITGESGSGKSTFVNAFRGMKNKDEGAAPTGCVETTIEVKAYPHPNYPNVTLWDLPGIGTTKFPAAKYLQHVGFEKYDFFIIISADRFRENDVKLAKEIQKMEKKFYFVRSKIDHNLRDEEENQSEFNAERTLAQIREYCVKGLRDEGFASPQVFLLASPKLQLYDFPLLHKTLERELPEHKRDVLLFAMPNISLPIIQKKKEALQAQIKYYAALSAAVAAVPLPGLSAAVDVALIVGVVKEYLCSFGLDRPSLEKLARSSGVSLEDLRATIRSPLALQAVTPNVIKKLLLQCANAAAFMAAEEVLHFIPLLGSMVAAGLSYKLTEKVLSSSLDTIAEDAQNVFKRALGLNTSV